MARDDWDWLRKFADNDFPPCSESDNFLFFLRSVPKTGWSVLLKKVRIRCFALQRIQADKTTLVRFQKSVFENFGHKLDEAVDEGDEPWQCYYCHHRFATFQAVRRHEAGAHKVEHVANLYLTDLECKSCLKVFSTKVNLRRHFTLIPKCLNMCRIAFPIGLGPDAPEVAKGLELQRLNMEGPMQGYGPLLEVSPSYQAAARHDVPAPPRGYAERELGNAQSCDRRNLHRRGHTTASRPLTDVSSIPPQLGCQRAILDAFGGRRRPGDIIDHLQQYVNTHTFRYVPVICVLDLVHGQAHDASRGAAVAWCRAILCGLCLGVFCGPPCETWSIARHNAIGDSKVVPVRSAAEPWRLPRMTQRQATQVTVGCFLLFVTIALFTLAIFKGGCALWSTLLSYIGTCRRVLRRSGGCQNS